MHSWKVVEEQVVEELETSTDATLTAHSDSIYHYGVKYTGYQLTTGKGQHRATGIIKISSRQSSEHLEGLNFILKKLAMLSESCEDSTLHSKKLLSKIKNTMGDGFSSLLVFNEMFNNLLHISIHGPTVADYDAEAAILKWWHGGQRMRRPEAVGRDPKLDVYLLSPVRPFTFDKKKHGDAFPYRVQRASDTGGDTHFMEWFAKLGELRCLVPGTPVLAVTAIVSKMHRRKIQKLLSMEGCMELIENPDWANIKLHVSNVPSSEPLTTTIKKCTAAGLKPDNPLDKDAMVVVMPPLHNIPTADAKRSTAARHIAGRGSGLNVFCPACPPY
ncbi:hypothetical protein Bbelb_343630 [Branchiostoma belcheri]|nr:hypothetical protein Bbelb_343630 [Branchiostoma belcheri]